MQLNTTFINNNTVYINMKIARQVSSHMNHGAKSTI
ncbi:hypothetical protein PLUTE_b6008 [Pseudoalteromonas luteoviolacea DSM 6061]|nr:hypothetical protein [Pseudoalteromonas luteoviolacea DSM 6061]